MLESNIILAIQKALSSPAERSMIGFIARWLIYFYLPFVFLYRKSVIWHSAIVSAGWSLLTAFALSSMIAWVIDRVRPFSAIPAIEAIVPPNIQSGSFPSSHTAIAVAIALSLSSTNIPVAVLVCAMALLIAFGRVAAGMHYPTDIMGGIAIGIIAHVIVRLVQEGMSRV